MRIAIFGKNIEEIYIPQLTKLFCLLDNEGVNYAVHHAFDAILKKKNCAHNSDLLFENHSDIVGNYDCLISIGGDGTILDTVSLVRDSGIPILGINTGRLGFLSNVDINNLEETIFELIENKFVLDKRTLLKIESDNFEFEGFNYALNDVSVHKKDGQSMITIHTFLNNELLNSYWADGLIISTPTGSTAYSLSCGGPIIMPESGSFVISPIAPHNLTVRPIVIPDKYEIKLKVQSRGKKFLLNIDSKNYSVDTSKEIKLTLAEFNINLIKLRNQHYFNTIRNKLMWGIDKRN